MVAPMFLAIARLSMAAFFAVPAIAGAVPLPPPRPADLGARAPQRAATPPTFAREAPQTSVREAPPANVLTYAPAPEIQTPIAPRALPGDAADACAALLASGAVMAERLAPVVGAGGCGIATPVKLKAIVLADKREIPLVPQPVLKCEMAAELAEWVIEDIAPLVEKGQARIARLHNAAAYDCRGQNRQVFAKLSEHGRGNAIDMRAIEMQDGARIAFVGGGDVAITRGLRTSACTRFSTILGPGSDGYHEDHVHVDLYKRRPGVSICRWNVR